MSDSAQNPKRRLLRIVPTVVARHRREAFHHNPGLTMFSLPVKLSTLDFIRIAGLMRLYSTDGYFLRCGCDMSFASIKLSCVMMRSTNGWHCGYRLYVDRTLPNYLSFQRQFLFIGLFTVNLFPVAALHAVASMHGCFRSLFCLDFSSVWLFGFFLWYPNQTPAV